MVHDTLTITTELLAPPSVVQAITSTVSKDLEPFTETPISLESLTNTPTATLIVVEPTATVTTWSPPDLRFIAIEPCRDVQVSGGGRYYYECGIEVYTPSNSEPVYYLSQVGVSYESPAFSPNGQWLAYAERGQHARVRLVGTNWQIDKPVTDELEPLTIAGFTWSPDSQWLAFDYGLWVGGDLIGSTYLVNAQSGELKQLGEDIGALAWSPSQPVQIAFAAGGQTTPFEGVYITSADDINNIQQLGEQVFNQELFSTSLAWNPDGSYLALCIGNESLSLWIFEFSSQTWQKISDEVAHDNCRLSWSPNGDLLAINTLEEISFYETREWQRVRTIVGVDTEFYGESWSKDNIFIYYLYHPNPPSSRLDTEIIATIADSILGGHEILWSMDLKVVNLDYVDILGLSWSFAELHN